MSDDPQFVVPPSGGIVRPVFRTFVVPPLESVRLSPRLSWVSDKALAVGLGRKYVVARIPAASALPLTDLRTVLTLCGKSRTNSSGGMLRSVFRLKAVLQTIDGYERHTRFNKHRCTKRTRRRRSGMVLLVVAVIVMLLSLVAYKYMLTMQTEHMAAAINGDRVQAQQAAYSVRDLLIVMLESSRKTRDEVGGLEDNPVYFGGDPTALSMGLAGASLSTSATAIPAATSSSVSQAGESSLVSSDVDSASRTPFGTIGYAVLSSADRDMGNTGFGSTASSPTAALRGTDSSVGANVTLGSTSSSGQAVSGLAVSGQAAPGEAGPLTRYGAKNESARLHLWTVLRLESANAGDGVAALMTLPEMDEATANSILDWLDEDVDPREQGAESEFYSMLTRPLTPRNGVPPDLDELLFVRGVDAWRLFGIQQHDPLLMAQTATSSDATYGDPTSSFGSGTESRNGSFGGSQFGASSRPTGTSFGTGSGSQFNAEPPLPWAEYLTVYSAERNETYAGQPRIFLNAKDLQELHRKLSQELSAEIANFLILFRQFGGAVSSQAVASQGSDGAIASDAKAERSNTRQSRSSQAPGENTTADSVTINFQTEAKFNIENPLDLIGATVTVPTEDEDEEPIVLQNPFGDDPAEITPEFVEMLDKFTIFPGQRIVGRVNVNEASATVLLALPGMDETIVEAIMTNRLEQQTGASFGSRLGTNSSAIGGRESRNRDSVSVERQHPIWWLSEGLVDTNTMRKLWPYVTCGGDVYRAEVWGYVDEKSPTVRFETVLDASTKKCRSVYYRELSAPKDAIRIKASPERIASALGDQPSEGGFGSSAESRTAFPQGDF